MTEEISKKQLAIIKNVHCGVGDYGVACLWFDVHIDESSSALTVLDWERAKIVIEKYGVRDVQQLNGKPCWVDTSTRGIIRFLEPAKI